MTISDFSRDAVCRYLRSVVFIDDKLFSTPHLSVENEALEVDGQPELAINGGTASSDNDSGLEISGGDAQGGGVVRFNNKSQEDAHAITDGFAKKGIICGVYKPMFFPETGFEDEEGFTTLLNICKNADVSILDWQLFKENDKAVAQLLAHILMEDKSSSAPNPVRFCAIYTAERVDVICDKVYTECKQIESSARQDVDARKVYAGGLTVCIYAKEEATSPGAVAAKDLAERIITDYAKAYEGILPAMALRGIASIRNNAKRILDKFPKGMDSALVLHAGLTLKEKSIVSDISSLLGDEMSSILNDMRVYPDDIYDLCAEYVHNSSDNVFEKTGNATFDKTFSDYKGGASVKHYLEEMFRQKKHCPLEGGNPITPVFTKKSTNKGKTFAPNHNLLGLFKSFVERRSADDSDYIFGALSALFCQRTIYSNQKILQFGTIVRKCSADGNPSQMYYLCLMPTCDSIRLEDVVNDESGVAHPVPHRFPFWELDFVSPEGEHRTHGLYVKVDGKYHSLCAKGKIRDKFHLMDFYSRKKVVPFDESGALVCVNGDVKLEWIAELKSAHVQRIAERVSREFSRVGLSESEWLRLQVD